LACPLLSEVKYTEPSDDPHSGNTLRDFQHFAYSTHGNIDLRVLAVEKTIQVFASYKLKRMDEFVAAFPDGMLVDFMKEMAQRWLRDRLELEEAQQQIEQYELLKIRASVVYYSSLFLLLLKEAFFLFS
jgi:hypothetical protein